MRFGHYLRQCRIEAGFGQRELARALDVSPSYINEIENEKRIPPNFDLLMKIKAILDISGDIIFDLASVSKNEPPKDIIKFVSDNDAVVELLRTVRNLKLSDVNIEKLQAQVASEHCKAIILAAGQNALGESIKSSRPVWQTKVNNLSILQHQLNAFQDNGINKVFIVTGYKNETINVPGLDRFHNDGYQNNGVLASLFCAETELCGNVIISYADTIFTKEVVDNLLTCSGDITIMVDMSLNNKNQDSSKVSVGERETVIFDSRFNLLDMGRSLDNKKNMLHGEFTGLMKLSPKGSEILKRNFHRAKDKYWSKPYQSSPSFQKAFISDLLKDMLQLGVQINTVFIEHGWHEIETTNDLQEAKNIFAKQNKVRGDDHAKTYTLNSNAWKEEKKCDY